MPPIIRTQNLRKVFRSSKRRPGFLGATQSLFALDGATFPELIGATARFSFDRDRRRIEDIAIEEPDLETIIRKIYVEGYDRNGAAL